MKRLLIVALVSLSSCSTLLPQGDDVDSEQVLKQHEAILNSIIFYVGNLQKAGILPSPEDLLKVVPAQEQKE